MATSGTTGLPFHLANHCELTSVSIPQTTTRRRITREARLAMRILGHAIEHLSEESVQENDLTKAHKGEIKAVKLLMALNSQIYAECPAFRPWRNQLAVFLNHWGI